MTPEDEPIPEPQNADQSLRPPTEMDGTLNPKFRIKETFVHGIFTGTNEKIRYTASLVSPPAVRPPKKRAGRVRKLSPTRQLYANTPIEPRVAGGPNTDFLARYGLDETSHPMDWFSAFMPMTQVMNKEDPAAANVKGDRTTKFAVSNWTSYSRAISLADAEDAGSRAPPHPWQRWDCGCPGAWLAAEAPVIPALLCIPGSPNDAPSKEAVPKLQG